MEQEEDQVVRRAEGGLCGIGGGSGGLESRRRIRWSGEQEEDLVEQEEDQMAWRAGGGSCDLESRRRIRWSG